MPDIAENTWSERDARNSELAPNGFPPGLPAAIEQIGRMMMGAIKRSYNRQSPVYLTSGTGDNYVVVTEAQPSFINLYEIIIVRIDKANITTTPTLKYANTIPRTIVKVASTGIVPLVAGDLVAGKDHAFWFNGTNFVLSNPGTVDSSATVGVLKTANNLSELTGTAGTARGNLGLGTAATQNIGTSGATVPLLNGANTWTTTQTVGGALNISNAAGTTRVMQWQTNGVNRWSARADSSTESGGNVGSNLLISRYDDSGTLIDFPLAITRSTGVVTLSQPLPVGSGGTGGATASAARTSLGAAASGANSDITSLSAPTILDGLFAPSSAPTKKSTFDNTLITAGQTRNIKVPDADVALTKWELIGDYTVSAAASQPVINLSAFRKIRISGKLVTSNAGNILLRTSTNNGSTYDSGASDYATQVSYTTNASAVSGGSTAATSISIVPGGNDAGGAVVFNLAIEAFNKAEIAGVIGQASFIISGIFGLGQICGQRNSTTARNAFQLIPSAGTFTGTITVEGVRG